MPTYQSTGRSSELRNVIVLITVGAAIRVILAALTDLGPDEAYFWMWSRHLAFSYYDHPPMVAYLIRVSTSLLGDGSLAVRLPAILLSAGFTYLIYRLSARLYGSQQTGWLAALLCTLCPVTFTLGFFMIPDASLMFFVALVLNLFWDYINGKRNVWWLAGIALGCAFLSKYHAVLVCASAVIFLLIGSRQERRLLLDWRLASAAGLALLIFSPVIIWNMQHHWISFEFQLRRGLASSGKAWWILLFGSLGGQLAYVSPVLWVGSVGALVRLLKESMHSSSARFAATFGGIPVVFFLFAGARSPGLPHWPAFGYAILLIGLAAWCTATRHMKKWMLWGGTMLGSVPLFLISLHSIVGLVALPYHVRIGERTVDIRDQAALLHGWNEWAAAMKVLTLPEGTAEGVAAVVTHNWNIGGKAAYALRDVDIPVIAWQGNRKTQFDFLSTPEEYVGRDLLFVTTSAFDSAGIPARAEHFYVADRFEQLPDLWWPIRNVQVTKFHMEVVRGFRGLRKTHPI